MLLDAHQHFWRHDAAQYPWISKGSPLHRDWLPGDLAELQRPLGIAGSIAVQARQSLAESDWLLGLADADPRVRAVVGWVDLRSPRVEEDLERLARHPRFAGVRHVVQDEPDDRFLLGADFLRGVGKLARFGLRYDVLIYARQLPATIEFVGKFPELPMVLNHIAKPDIKAGALLPWREQIRALARAPHLMCKVSGLVTAADPALWKPDDIRPFLDVIFEAFGPERILWGSDWPVCLLAASYERAFRLVDDYATQLTSAERAALFGGNCARFYL